MAWSKSKYSAEFNQEMNVRVFSVLADAQTALTNDEIKARDISLGQVTSQKISRILSELCDRGLVVRGKASNGHMTYQIR